MKKKNRAVQLPIRSKVEIIKDVVEIMHCLVEGKMGSAQPFLEDLKGRSLFLDEDIQRSVLIFSEQIQFQAVYGPHPTLTQNIQKAADQLLESLGFSPPKP